MSNRVLVVESNPERFNEWSNPDYGIGAQLEVLGRDGGDVVIERLATPADLFEVAMEVKSGEHLPARALVFQGVEGSDLARNPIINGFWMSDMIEGPADYNKELDPIWVWRGHENRPLSPYGRLIGSRLVQRALPDVNYYPGDGEYENWEQKYSDIFHWAYAGMGYDELRATYGGFLARVNKHLSVVGNDFMSLVDAIGERPFGSRSHVEGADISASFPYDVDPLVDISSVRLRTRDIAKQIGVVAKLLTGEYPGATPAFDDINYILPRKERLRA